MTAPPFDHSAAPLRIGRVHLTTRDLPTLEAFYRDALGLTVHASSPTHSTLGTPHTPLIELTATPDAPARNPQDAGLFHTAFLLPDRAALGRWLAHAGKLGLRLHGASDHRVSEALYLADPDGNGIEIYADRPPAQWHDGDGHIAMTTEPLDLPALRAASDTDWTGFPEDGIIGHVHLQVGDTARADSFYAGILGLDITARYPGASFYGSGGYHHQLASNIWNSRGAGPRPKGATGLAALDLIARDAATRAALLQRATQAGQPATLAGDAALLRDPWGTAILLPAH